MKKLLRTLGPCHCKRGIQRDNCPSCEGTGQAIDFSQFHKPTRIDDPRFIGEPTRIDDPNPQELTAKEHDK
jgi:hypothetical protein